MRALDRISTVLVEELPGLDVRIGSFMACDWPACATLPMDTYMNTHEETFRNGWGPKPQMPPSRRPPAPCKERGSAAAKVDSGDSRDFRNRAPRVYDSD